MEASLSFAATDCRAMPSTLVPFLDHTHRPKLTHIVFFRHYIMTDPKYLNICGWYPALRYPLIIVIRGKPNGQTLDSVVLSLKRVRHSARADAALPSLWQRLRSSRLQADDTSRKEKQRVHHYLCWRWISRSSFVTEKKLLGRPRKVRVTPCKGNWSAIKTPPDASENIMKKQAAGDEIVGEWGHELECNG